MCERTQSGDIFLQLCSVNGFVIANRMEEQWYSPAPMGMKEIVDFVNEMSEIFGLENENLIPLLILFDRISKIPFNQTAAIVEQQFDEQFSQVHNRESQLKINSYTVHR